MLKVLLIVWCLLVPEIIYGGAPEVFSISDSWESHCITLQYHCYLKPNENTVHANKTKTKKAL